MYARRIGSAGSGWRCRSTLAHARPFSGLLLVRHDLNWLMHGIRAAKGLVRRVVSRVMVSSGCCSERLRTVRVLLRRIEDAVRVNLGIIEMGREWRGVRMLRGLLVVVVMCRVV